MSPVERARLSELEAEVRRLRMDTTPRSTPENARDTGPGVQALADPVEGLVWTSPALPSAQADMGAAREHGLLDALEAARARVLADSAYRGAGANAYVPHRRPPSDLDTDKRHRQLSANEEAANSTHTRLRGPGERANAQLESWKLLRKARSSPRLTTRNVDAVRSIIHAS